MILRRKDLWSHRNVLSIPKTLQFKLVSEFVEIVLLFFASFV